MWIVGSLALNLPDSTLALKESATEALRAVPAIPRDNEGPVFAEPWQAQVFAMTLALYERGLFTWPEWAEQLSAAISKAQAAGDPDCGDNYYAHWLVALEAILQSKGLTDHAQLHQLQHAWADVAAVTPHGQPIELSKQQRVALTKGVDASSVR